MADYIMNVNPFKVTNSADTNVKNISFTGLDSDIPVTTLRITNISGTIYVSVNKTIDLTNSPSITSTDAPFYIDIRRNQLLYFKGGSGSETFTISALG